MFGLEKENKTKKKKKEKGDFDLEQELLDKPSKAKELISLAEKRIDTLKTNIKEGKNPEQFDSYGILLHGYAAMKRVVKKVEKAKAKK